MSAAHVKQKLSIREDKNWANETVMTMQQFVEDYLAPFRGSPFAHPGALRVSSGDIMKKNSRSPLIILFVPVSDTPLRSGVLTDLPQQTEMLLNCRSGGGVVIQSVEKTELAYHLDIAPFAVLANGITKSARLILSVFKGSGTTSAPATIPKGPLFVIDIDPQWMVDSGASASLTGDRSLLQGLHAADRKGFMVANGEVVWSDSCGRASGRVNLPGIRFVPDCNKNIISATHLVRLGCEVIFNDQGCTIRKNGTLIGKAPAHAFTDGLYYLDFLNDTLLVSICPACPHPGAQGN